MAKKEKKLSVNTLENMSVNQIAAIPVIGMDGVEITVRRTLSLVDVLGFITDVVALCVDEATGTYMPEVKDFAIKANVLTRYANFSLPANTEKQYELIYTSNAYELVLGHINTIQLDEIIDAIDAKIECAKNSMISTAARMVSELNAKVSEFIEQSERLFANVSGDDVSALMQNLASQPKLDERTLVKAVFDEQRKDGGESGIADNAPDNVITLSRKAEDAGE